MRDVRASPRGIGRRGSHLISGPLGGGVWFGSRQAKELALPKPKRRKTQRALYVGKTVELGSQCEAITQAGRRCSRDGTVHCDSKKKFCVQHAHADKPRTKDAQVTSRGQTESVSFYFHGRATVRPAKRNVNGFSHL